MKNKEIVKNFDTIFNSSLISSVLPVSLAFFGVRRVLKIIMEEKIEGIDKKDLFSYIFQQRTFIESLSDDEIKYYYKNFKKLYKLRKKENIKQIICVSLFGYRNI